MEDFNGSRLNAVCLTSSYLVWSGTQLSFLRYSSNRPYIPLINNSHTMAILRQGIASHKPGWSSTNDQDIDIALFEDTGRHCATLSDWVAEFVRRNKGISEHICGQPFQFIRDARPTTASEKISYSQLWPTSRLLSRRATCVAN